MEEREQAKPKVVILTAGVGSRLKKRTEYFNKALLRIGNKAVISHTIDQFSDDVEFVIALGYKGDIVRQYLKIAHPQKKITFIEIDKYLESGTGPGYSLLKCREELQCPFFFFSCDSIIQPSTYTHIINSNWIGINLIDKKDVEHYCTAKLDDKTGQVIELIDKQKSGTTYAFVGVAFIKDYKDFWKAMSENKELIKNEIQLSPALSKLNTFGLPMFWWDIGNEDGLEAARIKFPGIQNLDKIDEELYVVDNHVIKYFHDSDIVKQRLFRATQLKNCVPDIINSSENFYKYQFVKGKDLFKVPNVHNHIEDLLNYMQENLWIPTIDLSIKEEEGFIRSCKEFYFDKTMTRLNQFWNNRRLQDKKEIINNLAVSSIDWTFGLLNWDEYIAQGIPCDYFHGDTYFGNIIFTTDETFQLIDWRQNFAGNPFYGDIYYDLAKMYNSFLFPASSVNSGNFYTKRKEDGTIKTYIEISKDLQKCKKKFESWVTKNNYDIQKVKVLTALVMLNMSPLHEKPLDEYLYYFGRYYLQKVLRNV